MCATPLPRPVTDAAARHCEDLARRHDRERWLAALLAPAAARPRLFALLAFNFEVAKTRESVSQPMLGQIRLQWWRESVDSIFGGRPRAHLVVEALAAAHAAQPFRKEGFERMIDARERDLEDEPFAALAELEAYAEATAGGYALLALEALGAEAEAAARKAGAAWAMVGLLRAVPFHASRRLLRLPREGLNPEDVYRGRPTPEVRAAVRAVLERAERLSAEARGARPKRRALPALPPLRLLDLHARQLRAAAFDPFAADYRLSEAAAPLRVGWSRFAGL